MFVRTMNLSVWKIVPLIEVEIREPWKKLSGDYSLRVSGENRVCHGNEETQNSELFADSWDSLKVVRYANVFDFFTGSKRYTGQIVSNRDESARIPRPKNQMGQILVFGLLDSFRRSNSFKLPIYL